MADASRGVRKLLKSKALAVDQICPEMLQAVDTVGLLLICHSKVTQFFGPVPLNSRWVAGPHFQLTGWEVFSNLQ